MELLHKIRNLEHIKLAVVFVGLNIIDAVLTLVLHAGGGYELNWVVRRALEHSPWTFGLIKAGVTLIFVSYLLLSTEILPRLVKWIFIVSTIVMLGACIFNAIQLIIV